MSRFGGDSWAREAQHRKRRVDDLILSSSSSSSSKESYKQLSNGKLVCLVCPHGPILDSPLAFAMHAKSSRHAAAVSRLKERELSRQDELKKRIALSSDAVTACNNTPVAQAKRTKVHNHPLIEQTRKAILETHCSRSWDQVARNCSSVLYASCDLVHSTSNHVTRPPLEVKTEGHPENRNQGSIIPEAAGKMLTDWNNELHKRHEKELKFISAGWKRDGFGKWYKDENVEFDSDEEDPNETINLSK